MGKIFELVVFTASKQCYADKIVEFLDPTNEFISFRFYREHCTFVDGTEPNLTIRNVHKGFENYG